MAPAAAENVALDEPDGTLTEPGTVRAVALLPRVTAAPVSDAA